MAYSPVTRTEHLVPGTSNVWRPGSPSHEETDATLKQYLWLLERAHNTALHGPGVADGLTVEATPGASTVRVRPGVAIDRDGRHIVLAPGGKAELAATPALPSSLTDVTDAGVEVPVGGAAGQRNLVIQWRESFAKDLHDQDSAVFRTRHTPWLRLLPPAPPPDADDPPEHRVLLAVLTVADNGTVAAGGAVAGERATSGLGAGAVRLVGIAATTTAASSAVSQTTAATVAARPGGGLEVRLPGSNAPAVVVDSGGGVGIGLGSPTDRLHVAGSIRADAGLTVAGPTALAGAVRVTATGATLDKDLTVAGTTSLAGPATVAGTTTLRGQLTAESAVTLAGPLRVNKTTTLDRELTVAGPTSLGGNLNVTGPTALAGTVRVAGAATLDKDLTVAGTTTLRGQLTAESAVTLAGPLRVNKTTTLDRELTVAGPTSLSGNLNVTGPTALAGTVRVAGAATLDKDLTVAGATTLRGQVTAESAVTLAGPVRVNKTTTLDRELSVGGATSLSSNLTVAGGVSVGGNVNVSGWLIGNSAQLSGSLQAGNFFGTSAWMRNASNDNTVIVDSSTGKVWANGPTDWRQLGGSPARYVRVVWLFVGSGNTTVADVDLGSSRQVFAFVCMTGCDPLDPVEQSDALALDVFAVDGAATSSSVTGGAHWGAPGNPANVRAPAYSGSARTITFRARSMQSMSVMGIGVVFYE